MKIAALLGLMLAVCLQTTAAPLRVALVFDDGPVPEDAAALLALLAKEEIPATFALVGQRVSANPATARAVATAGHEVVNHSQTHAALKDLDADGIEREVADAQRALTTALGHAPQWYWPAFLTVDDRLRAAVTRVGIKIYPTPHLVISKDYDKAVTAREIFQNSTTGVRDGSVILFHEWRTETREQLPAILAELRRQGCTFHTFTRLLESLKKTDP